MSTSSFVCTLPPLRPPFPLRILPIVVHDHVHANAAQSSSGVALPLGSTAKTGAGGGTGVSSIGGSSSSGGSAGASAAQEATVPFSVLSSETTSTTFAGQAPSVCSDVGWGHVGSQMLVVAVPWFFMSVGGLAVTSLAPQHAAAARSNLQRFECGLASLGLGPALAVLMVHAMQCFFFAIRASTGIVDPLYYALETIGSLYVLIDVSAKWSYVVSSGFVAVVRDAFTGPLILDLLVCTSIIGVAIRGFGDVGLTWWSFNFLAALRMMRVVQCLQRGDTSLGQWRRHVAYNVATMVLFVFASAASVMTFEILETPGTRGSDEDLVWDLFPSVAFVCMTMLSIGSSSLAPQSVFGRAFAVGLIAWSCHHLATKVAPIARDLLLGKNFGLNTYRPSPNQRHVVVVGTPTGPMLWDFLLETFHPNHFESAMDFHKDAPNVVILLSEECTLMHMRMFLERREALWFRERVVLLRGDAFRPEDLGRAAVSSAERVVVLPNLCVADVAGDDATNIMRTFALGATVPHVPVTCMLHCAEHNQSALSSGGESSFVSIDAFKLSLLASASLTRGALTLICNLCKTIGDMEFEGQQWQRDYERSLGYELYETPLSPAYHNETFSTIVWDALARSEEGDVYLIGLIQMDPEVGRRLVRIHPGADYRVSVESMSHTAGVFIAPDISSIVQCEVGDELIVRGLVRPIDTPSSVSLEDSFFGTDRGSKATPVNDGMQMSQSYACKGADDKNPAATMSPAKIVPPTAEERQERFAMSKYESSMTAIKKRLLVHGFNPDVVAAATGLLSKGEKTIGDDAGASSTKGFRSAPPGQEHITSPTKKMNAAARLLAESRVQHHTQRELQEFGSQGALDQLQELKKLQSRQERMERMVLRTPGPPPAVLHAGNHLLLCVVSDTVTSISDNCQLSGSALGPNLGIGHFMKPLRDAQVAGKVRTAEQQPTVIVLADALPGDWHSVVDYDRVFFVRGSAMEVNDLEKAGVRQARAIVVMRGHAGSSSGARKAADARMILATHVIESHLPLDSQIPVITDHAYDGTCELLPMGALSTAEIGSMVNTSVPPLPMAPARDVAWASSLFSSNASVWNELGTGRERHDEDYEELDSCDYAHHPRWMRGDMFVAGALTALVANTLYNPSLVPMVNAMIESSMLLLPLPVEWVRRTYEEFSAWLLDERDLLTLGIYRSSAAVKENEDGERVSITGPTMHYMFTSPPGRTTKMVRSDRILCLAPSAPQ